MTTLLETTVLVPAAAIAGCVSAATVIRRDEPMAKHTTLRVGGPADVYVEPAQEADLAAVRVMDYAGQITEMTPAAMAVEYRCCATLKNRIALGAVFQCRPEPRAEIEARMKAYSEKRWSSQPAAPSAGCMFKNPATIPAGRLIDELGLKGAKIGGARISLEHGNFLVNDGGATAADVLTLIELLKTKAREARGIELHTEVEIVGG